MAKKKRTYRRKTTELKDHYAIIPSIKGKVELSIHDTGATTQINLTVTK